MLSLKTYSTPEEDPGITDDKEIGDLLMKMEKFKSSILFSPVLPESPSGVTIGQRLKDRACEVTPEPSAYLEKSHIIEGPQK